MVRSTLVDDVPSVVVSRPRSGGFEQKTRSGLPQQQRTECRIESRGGFPLIREADRGIARDDQMLESRQRGMNLLGDFLDLVLKIVKVFLRCISGCRRAGSRGGEINARRDVCRDGGWRRASDLSRSISCRICCC